MSFIEKEVEPVSHANLNNNVKKVIIKRRPDINIPDEVSSDLGKRKMVSSFGPEIYNDKERYGQDIPDDFFKTNIGHDVLQSDTIVNPVEIINEAEILDWCYKYLASKKIQI